MDKKTLALGLAVILLPFALPVAGVQAQSGAVAGRSGQASSPVSLNAETPRRALLLRVAQATSEARVALVIGNASYPDDNRPLAHPLKDARAVADELRRDGFDVVTGEDLSKQKLRAALDSFKAKIRPGSAALLFYSGYGIQTGKQSYIIPVDAQIWTEGEVRRDGTSIESILADMQAAGATVKIVIIDAARRNPFERRFRGFSAGLASLNAPAGTLAMYSAATDKVVNDSDGDNSLFVSELLKEMRSPSLSAEGIFNNTRMGVSRASKNEQVPWVSSSLIEEFSFARPAQVAVSPPPSPRPAPAPVQPPPRPTPEAQPVAPPTTVVRPEPTPPPVIRPEPPAPAVVRPEPPPPPAVRPEPPPQPVARPEPVRPSPVERDRVIASYDQAISRNPNDANSYYKRGQAWAERREYALASEDFGQAIRLNPNDAEAYNNRCWTRAVIGQLQGALSDCNEALRLRPNYVDALDSRGLANLKLGQFDRALIDFDAALRLKPRLASSLYGRGKSKLRRGDISGGNADIAAAKTIDPKVDEEFASYGVQ